MAINVHKEVGSSLKYIGDNLKESIDNIGYQLLYQKDSKGEFGWWVQVDVVVNGKRHQFVDYAESLSALKSLQSLLTEIDDIKELTPVAS